ncbi:MAG TPA: CocE/NonD family hydrolase [Kiritimatiellia bacterium]|mgnify:FL=1|nr:CocE/NonD family hydrolase [Kiritimatiellia bacterium]
MGRYAVIFLAVWSLAAANAQQWTTNDINGLLSRLPPGAVHRHEMVPMRDGAKLSTHFFLPASNAATNYPVLLMRSAYDHWTGDNRSRHIDLVVNRTDTNNLVYRNTNGYVVVLQDLRGDGDSESGVGFDPRLSLNEINDTYDTIDAIVTNTWCNGRVGMRGGSGHGMAAYMGWLAKHTNLVVALPGNTAPSLYSHWSFENGVRRWIYNWVGTHRKASTPTWPKPALGEYYSNQQWLDVLAAGAVNNPSVLIHDSDRWFNFFLDATFEVFTALQGTTRGHLIMDRGNHQGEIAALPFPWAAPPANRPATPSFFDILDGNAVYTNSPFLDYYVLGDARRGASAAGNFRRLATHWPPPAIPTPWYFHSNGSLSQTAPTSGTDTLSYSYHPTNPVPTVGGNFSYGFTAESGPFNQLVPQLTDRTDILRFESAPFTEPTEITGKLTAELYISTDVEDTTFMVKLIDIYPAEGTNTEYHAILRESAIMARYWDGFDNPQPLTSGAVYRLDIDMSSIAVMIETNHRLAVHITSSSDPAFEVHPNTYSQVMSYASSPTANNTLHLNTNYPSRIILPFYTTNAPTVNTSTSAVGVPEGGTETFEVWMSGPALAPVTLTVARVSGDVDITVQSGASLFFSLEDWATPQIVTLAAAEDADAIEGVATFQITAPGVVPATVIATEIENDVGIVASASSLFVPEGGTNSFSLTLNRAPAHAITVTVSRISGDPVLSVAGAAAFVFTPSDWNTPQTVLIASGQDADDNNDVATFRCDSPYALSVDVTVTQIDNDRTLVASGKLMAWNLDSIPVSIVTQTSAYTVATGLINIPPYASLEPSSNAIPVTSSRAVSSRGHNQATLAGAIATNRYYSWIVAPVIGHDVTITSVSFRTKSDSPIITVLFSSVTGFNAGDELATHPSGLQFTTVDVSTNPAFVNLTAPVEFRVYGYGASSAFTPLNIGNAYTIDNLDDIQVFGDVYQTFAPPVLETSATNLAIPEGGTNVYFLRLNAEPVGVWTAVTERISGDPDLTVLSGASIIFDDTNWSTWQPVVLAAADDLDFVNGSATFRSVLQGTSSQTILTATEVENDLGVELSTSQLAVPEGASSNMSVRLPRDPGGPVTVTITKEAGDPDLSLTSSASLDFTSANWSNWQTVTFAAIADADAVSGAALFSFGGGTLTPVYLRVTETDPDDPPEGMIGPPRSDWRLPALDVDASANAAAIKTALTNRSDSSMSTGGQSAWLAVNVPALANPAMLTFEANTLISGSALQSFNSTDGHDGIWEPIPLTIYQPNTGPNRLQKLDINWGASRWVRLAITNNSPAAFTLSSLGLYQLEPGGWNDYWVIAGASIEEWSIRNMTFKGLVQTNFGYDPVIFNVAFAGSTSTGIFSRLGADLGRHPHARFIAVGGGGNDITPNRPFPGGAAALSNNMRNALSMIVASNRIPILGRLTFRIYSTEPVCDPANVPGSETNGALPYVTAIYDPLTQEFCPLFIDPNTGLNRIDAYTHFFENQNELSPDGLHPNAAGNYSLNVLWSQGAGAVVYSTNYVQPIAIQTSTSVLTIAAGQSSNVSVRLAAEPSGVVTAIVTRTSGNTNVTVTAGGTLVFDDTNWNQGQTVTLAVNPASTLESAVFSVSGAGLIATTITVHLPDTIPPAAIGNLSAGSPTANSLTLTWTVPTDAGSGNASYDIRRSTAAINAGNFASATVVGAPAPATPGTTQSVVAAGLDANTLYYFAMKTIDAAGNTSDVSNVASASTLPATDGLLHYEGFDYGDPGGTYNMNSGYNGGTGWNGAWAKQSAGVGGDYQKDIALTYTSGVRTLVTAGGSMRPANNGLYYYRSLGQFYSGTGGDQTLWVSFLAYGTPNTAFRVIEFINSSNGVTATAAAQRLAVGNNNAGAQQWQIGVDRYTASTNSGVAISTNAATPDFILLKIELKQSANDTARMWINPDLATEPTTGGVVFTRTGTQWTFDTFRITVNSASNLGLDEIRIGEGWSDVTPTTGGGPTEQYNNGVPYSWLNFYNYDPANVDVNATVAANGVNTLKQAFIAGLDPTNPNAVFEIANMSSAAAHNVLIWSPASGRVYGVHWSSNLLNGFQSIATNIPVGVYTDSVHHLAPQSYYQIKVELAP